MNIIGNQLVEWIARFDLLGQQSSDGAVRNVSDGSNQFCNVAFIHNTSRSGQRRTYFSPKPCAALGLELGDHVIFSPGFEAVCCASAPVCCTLSAFLRRFTVDFDQIGVDVAAQRTGGNVQVFFGPAD